MTKQQFPSTQTLFHNQNMTLYFYLNQFPSSYLKTIRRSKIDLNISTPFFLVKKRKRRLEPIHLKKS